MMNQEQPPLLDPKSPLLDLPQVKPFSKLLTWAFIIGGGLLLGGSAYALVSVTKGRADPEEGRRYGGLPRFSDAQLSKPNERVVATGPAPGVKEIIDAAVFDEVDRAIADGDKRWSQPITLRSPEEEAAEANSLKQNIRNYDPGGHQAALAASDEAAEPEAQPVAAVKSKIDPMLATLDPAEDSLDPPKVESPVSTGQNTGGSVLPGLTPPEDQQDSWAAQARSVPRHGAQRARAACQISAGRQMDAHLQNVIDTTVGGQLYTLTFILTRDVACSGRGDRIALPQGAQLVGSVNTQVRAGQKLVQACANRAEVLPGQLSAAERRRWPNGWTAELGCIPLASDDGRIGVEGDLDMHLPEQIAAALITMMTSFGARAIAMPQTTYGPNVGQYAADGVAQGAGVIGQNYVQQLRAIKPTLRFVPTAKPVRLIANADIVVEGMSP